MTVQQLDDETMGARQLWAAVLQQWIDDIALGAANVAFGTRRMIKGERGIDAYCDFNKWEADTLPEMWRSICDILDLDAVIVWERLWQRIAAIRDGIPPSSDERIYLEAIEAGFTLAEAHELAA